VSRYRTHTARTPQSTLSALVCDRLFVLLSPKGEDPVAPKQWVSLAKEGPSPAAVINHKTHPLHKRLLVIPRKKLPDIDQHERLLGAVGYFI
jgi:hypothetical protein